MPSLGGGLFGTAKVGFTGDTSGLDRAIVSAKTSVNGFGAATEHAMSGSDRIFSTTGSSIQAMAGKLLAATTAVSGFMAAWAGYQAISGVVSELGRVVKTSSDLNETTSKFHAVFAGMEGDAEKWAAELNRSYGLSRQGSMGALSDLTTLSKGMGLPAATAGELSSKFIKLAVDLGSFHNLDTVHVLDAIRSAMVGEYDPIQRFAGAINASTIEAKALSMGLAATASELTAADKIMALYEMTLESNTAALGDFSKTSSGLANQQRILDANIEDVRGAIGSGLSPAIASVLQIINDWIDLQQQLQDQGLPNFISQVTILFTQLGTTITENRDVLMSIANNAIPGLLTSVGYAVEVLRFFENAWLGIKLVGQVTFQALVEGLAAIVNGLNYVMTPMNLLYDALIDLGVVGTNPFKNMVLAVNDFRDASALTTVGVLDDITKTNAKYDSWRASIDGLKSKIGEIPPVHEQMTTAINSGTQSVIEQYASMGSAMVAETAKYSGDVHVKFQNGLVGPVVASIGDITGGWDQAGWSIVGTTEQISGEAAQKFVSGLKTPMVESMADIESNWEATTGSMLSSFTSMVDKSTAAWGDFSSMGDSMGGGSYAVPDDWYYDYTTDQWRHKPNWETASQAGAQTWNVPSTSSSAATSASNTAATPENVINVTINFSPSYMTGDKAAAQNVARELFAEFKKLAERWV